MRLLFEHKINSRYDQLKAVKSQSKAPNKKRARPQHDETQAVPNSRALHRTIATQPISEGKELKPSTPKDTEVVRDRIVLGDKCKKRALTNTR